MNFADASGLKGGGFIGSSRRTTDADDYRDPAVSPPGDTTRTTPLSEEQRRVHEELVSTWNEKLENATAEEIFDWIHEHVPGTVAVTMSMQDTILAELSEGRLMPSWCSWTPATTSREPCRPGTTSKSATACR